MKEEEMLSKQRIGEHQYRRRRYALTAAAACASNAYHFITWLYLW